MKRLLFLANRDFVLYNFRFELIKKLIENGNEVYIALPYGPKVDIMVKAGARFVPLDIDGRGKNIFRDYKLLIMLKKIIRNVSPDVVLLYTTKIDLYGGIVAGKEGIPYIINVSGLGTAVGKKSFLQRFLIIMYKKAVENANCVFFQNKYNRDFFHQKGIMPKKEHLIPGSGVNIEYWDYEEYPNEDNGIHFLFIARIIKEKGIDEYLHTAEELKKRSRHIFFHVIGPCDDKKYIKEIEEAQKKEIIQYHGMVEDTREYLRMAHCLIHPSYYPEGISNVCLEAAACGRPIITTDNPGCRDTVDDGVTGMIVPIQNCRVLIEKVNYFIQLDWEKKRRLGLMARNKVVREYNREIVVDKYMEELNEIKV
ncbi:glycosyltransferase family 4 protein [Butyrivibrio sp. WCD2001]|uniref:glycosyltransferase family 4 protein n=1 Tax=Butyrivibrio sp. WCD2001 TaxID=1280681 RepID=UPI00040385E0|nr:glycosyltransferase family 4 protein [Butyrivibrio sp. WCD2001]